MPSFERGSEPAPEVPIEVKSEEQRLAEQLFEERRGATIYRVPPEIYECDEKAYRPKAVCIGPFFYGERNNPAFITMQEYKKTCPRKLVSKYRLPEEEAREMMKDLSDEVGKRYSDKCELFSHKDEFSEMLMLDGCFLLYLLLRYAKGAASANVDLEDAEIIYGRYWIWNLVRYDLLLLQNQIPFHVIQKLNGLLPDNKKENLVDCAINFFSPLHPSRKPEQTRFYIPGEKVHHLLHLFYLSVLPCPQRCETFPEPKLSRQWIPSATELQLHGIKFKKRKKTESFVSFLDVKFSDGVMEIPQLKVYDYSISLFRNLIAFEQCFPGTKCHVTAFAFFINFLIDTEEDMRLLQLNGVLINSMTVKKHPRRFFRDLCNELHYTQEDNYLRKLLSDVTEHCDSPWHKWRAEINRNYFRTLTVLSLINTVFLAFIFSGTSFVHTIIHF